MATQAQILANRANAQKSTGPKTPAGKAASSRNSVSHGFNNNIAFLKMEDPREFKLLHDDFIRQYQPATTHEQVLVEKMVLNQWNSLRAIRLQGLLLGASVAHGFIDKSLDLLLRYQSAADRAFHKAHAELVKALQEREKSTIGFVSQNLEEAPPAPEPQPPNEHESNTFQDRANLKAEIDWVMNATVDEIKASQIT